jgi:Cdc6-like AAA superfamily ATPase
MKHILQRDLPVEEQIKMAEVCYRITNLEELKEKFKTPDLIKLAERDYVGLPKTLSTAEKILNPVSQYWTRYSSIFEKIVSWVIMTPIELISNKIQTVLDIFEGPARNPYEIQLYWSWYKSMFKAALASGRFFVSCFPSTQIAALAAVGSTATYGSLYYLTKCYFKIGLSVGFDTDTTFQNLNKKVKEGKIEKGIERVEEKSELAACWLPFPNKPFRIAFLTGPAGIGKTQFVENLAWSCVHDKNSTYYGKTVLSINADKLKGYNAPRILDGLFQEIAGNEDNFILFFDEAHNAGPDQFGMNGGYLEILKTLLPEKNVRCIMATTTAEYTKYIAPNEAFVERTKNIAFKPLDKTQIKSILRQEVSASHGHAFNLTESMYDAILEVDSTAYKDRADPRKSLHVLQDVLGKALEWRPSSLNSQLQKQETQKIDLETVIAEHNANDPHWSSSEKGDQFYDSLAKTNFAIESLREQLESQTRQLKNIRNLQNLISEYGKKWRQLIDELQGAEKSEETQKQYLCTKFILLPHLRSSIKKAAESFEQQFKEGIPLTIDAEFVKGLFPDQASP